MSQPFHYPKLLIASTNQGKLRELKDMLRDYPVELISAAAYSITAPEETGTSFAENALLKARYYSNATNLPALADDSGLSVNGLGGMPGIYSARWAEKGYAEAFARIQSELPPAPTYPAQFICALCLYYPDGTSEQVEGTIRGNLTFPPRGEGGFGYDPIFIPEGYDRSFAEIGAAEKNAISHRADALRKLKAKCFLLARA